MMVFKRNQVVVLSLVILIVIAGYLQYNHNKSSSFADKDESKPGEAVYVNNEDILAHSENHNTTENKSNNTGTNSEGSKESKDGSKDNKDNSNTNSTNSNGELSASKQANNYFSQTKMNREITRGKTNDALQAIIEDENATKEEKAQAFNKKQKVLETTDKEMRIEALIRKNGYDDIIVLFGDDGSIDVVVKTPNLTAQQTAQIADIVSRQGKVSMEQIFIRSKW